MKLPHELEKLRDDLALKNYPPYETQEGDVNESSRLRFKAGFAACFQALSEAAGEFDEIAFKEAYGFGDGDAEFPDYDYPYDLCLKFARWQFDSARARIGLAEVSAKAYQGMYDVVCKDRKQLEARLAESAERMDRELRYQIELQDSLSVAEARVKELEAKLKMAIEYLEPRLAGKSGSRGLTIVLPALREALKGTDGDD